MLIGTNRDALEAASRKAESLGYRTLVLSSMIEGETRHVATVHAAIAREIRKSGHPIPAPSCVLSGGETTVTLTGGGRGGRNQEFSLASAIGISGVRDIVMASAGTDGTDGPTDAAGAFADSETVERARRIGLSASDHLAGHNAYPFFEALGDLWITGPTRTNVMDLRIVLVG
jgi:hydroxypyruvate reductase